MQEHVLSQRQNTVFICQDDKCVYWMLACNFQHKRRVTASMMTNAAKQMKTERVKMIFVSAKVTEM